MKSPEKTKPWFSPILMWLKYHSGKTRMFRNRLKCSNKNIKWLTSERKSRSLLFGTDKGEEWGIIPGSIQRWQWATMDQAALKRQMWFNSASNETPDTCISHLQCCVYFWLLTYEKEIVQQENDATESRGTGKFTLQEEAKESLAYLAVQKRNWEVIGLVPEYIFKAASWRGRNSLQAKEEDMWSKVQAHSAQSLAGKENPLIYHA